MRRHMAKKFVVLENGDVVMLKKMSPFVQMRFNQKSCIPQKDKYAPLRWLAGRCTRLTNSQIDKLTFPELIELYMSILNLTHARSGFKITARLDSEGLHIVITKTID
jgi:hypothetical protein